jgi:hypothetical protein
VEEAGSPLTKLDVIALVVLIKAPATVPTTFTVKVQEVPAGRVAPERPILPKPAVAVIVPPPQEPVRPLGVATDKPVGNESVKPTFDKSIVMFGFVIMKLRAEVWLKPIVEGVKDLLNVRVGGLGTVKATMELGKEFAVEKGEPATGESAPVPALIVYAETSSPSPLAI